MQGLDAKNSPRAQRLRSKKGSASNSTKRSQKKSSSPKNTHKTTWVKRDKKLGTPRAVPKLKISKLFSPRSPRKANPSTTRSRKKSVNSQNPLLSTALIQRNPSEKDLVEDLVTTSQLLQASKRESSIVLEGLKFWDALKLPTTPPTILQLLPNFLTKYEQSEILSYHEVYFIGLQARKTKTKIDGKLNYGYDDERGDYKIEPNDHIAYRYEILKILGSGSFGQVLHAKDHKTGKECAIKIIRNKTRFHQQALVEVEVLKLITEKDCSDNYNLCIVFELLSINLYELIKSNDFNGLSNNLIRRFANQIATTLKLLARYQIIHCDLKPENILLKQPNRSSIKVIDFGSSCFYDKRVYTYIQSRFYRAPEIILGISYTTAIDVWSFGCILVELHTGYPLFPGENEAEQILCIMEVFGLPPKAVLKQATRASKFFEDDGSPKIVTNSRGKKRLPGSKKIESVMKGAEAELVDLVKKCFEWDPAARIKPNDILQHEWMKENRLSSTKNFSRGGSAQPHQGGLPKHNHKYSLEEAQLSIRNSFLATGSCKNKKMSTFVF